MYVRVVFENLDSEDTQITIGEVCGIPNGTCLHTSIFTKDLREKFGASNRVWYVESDDNTQDNRKILNHLLSVASSVPKTEARLSCECFDENTRNRIESLFYVVKMAGVKSVEVLPFDDPAPTYGTPEWDRVRDLIIDYIEKHPC
jgi:hypothetical protein